MVRWKRPARDKSKIHVCIPRPKFTAPTANSFSLWPLQQTRLSYWARRTLFKPLELIFFTHFWRDGRDSPKQQQFRESELARCQNVASNQISDSRQALDCLQRNLGKLADKNTKSSGLNHPNDALFNSEEVPCLAFLCCLFLG